MQFNFDVKSADYNVRSLLCKFNVARIGVLLENNIVNISYESGKRHKKIYFCSFKEIPGICLHNLLLQRR
jgi:hypothetical protein